ncbi:HAEPLYID family protein [Chishuiella changwenlii]|uniref:HAEPLYID family protein n=1 Tax=Chishuiella changwenlii TaxID=1434701 RepID=UPI002FD93A87
MKLIKQKYYRITFISFLFSCTVNAQQKELPKVHHAEPLYLDLVRDLGARKGEKEVNVGMEFAKHKNYNEFMYLAEYEFAPVNRLGLEVEADFSFYGNKKSRAKSMSHQLEALRFSSQYSFFVSEKTQTTFAVGYSQIVDFNDFNKMNSKQVIAGTNYNPFFIAAKKWGNNWHTLLFFSPIIEQSFEEKNVEMRWELNSSIYYNLPGTSHYVGLEFNEALDDSEFSMVIHPEVKIKMNNQLAVGLVNGFSINHHSEDFSLFGRVIYEL